MEGTSSDGRDTTRLGALFAPSTRSDGTAHVDFCTMPKGRFGSKSVIWRSSANVVGATQPRLTTITNSFIGAMRTRYARRIERGRG